MNYLKKILLVTFCFLFVHSKAQTFEWAKSCNSSATSFMVRDKGGNFYVADNQGVAKYNPIGNFIWQQPVTGFGIRGIDVDSIGNLYVTGIFYGTVTLGGFTLTSDPDNNNIYLAKYNPAGIVQWISRSHNSSWTPNNISSDAITVDKQGNPIIIGRFTDSLRLDAFTFKAPETNQVFLAKYSPSGICLWAKHLISDSFDGGYNGPKIKSDKSGNTYISGHFINWAIFDSIEIYPHGNLDQDIFLTKIDASGNFLWAKVLGGNLEEISGPMDVDSIGNTYISGYFSSAPTYFGSYTLTTNWDGYFTAKYDTDGNCLWAKYASADVICAANDGYYTNYPDYIRKYDTLGNLQWTKNVTGATNNAMVAVNTDVYITGSYNGSVYFDTCALNSTSNQMYIAKLGNPIIVTNIKEKESNAVFSVYPNPTSRIITINISPTSPKQSFTLKVNNSLGKTVYFENLKEISGSYTKQIDLSALSKGIYLVELQSNTRDNAASKQVTKLVLQ